jgi:hypothetical protein
LTYISQNKTDVTKEAVHHICAKNVPLAVVEYSIIGTRNIKSVKYLEKK